MTRVTAIFVHCAVLFVGLTGLIYAWMCYIMRSEDEFALVNHPLQPDVQHLHILTAVIFVFASGLIWSTHVWKSLRRARRVRRRSGLLLATLLFPMIASGYAIQVSTDETSRELWAWIHGLSSSIWLLAYLVHQCMPLHPRRPRDSLVACD